MKFVTFIWFSARVSTALRIFSSVRRWPRAFQVPKIVSWNYTWNIEVSHNKSSHHTNSRPKTSQKYHPLSKLQILSVARHSTFLLHQQDLVRDTSPHNWQTQNHRRIRQGLGQWLLSGYRFEPAWCWERVMMIRVSLTSKTTLPSLSLLNRVMTSSTPLIPRRTKCLPVELRNDTKTASVFRSKVDFPCLGAIHGVQIRMSANHLQAFVRNKVF